MGVSRGRARVRGENGPRAEVQAPRLLGVGARYGGSRGLVSLNGFLAAMGGGWGSLRRPLRFFCVARGEIAIPLGAKPLSPRLRAPPPPRLEPVPSFERNAPY